MSNGRFCGPNNGDNGGVCAEGDCAVAEVEGPAELEGPPALKLTSGEALGGGTDPSYGPSPTDLSPPSPGVARLDVWGPCREGMAMQRNPCQYWAGRRMFRTMFQSSGYAPPKQETAPRAGR